MSLPLAVVRRESGGLHKLAESGMGAGKALSGDSAGSAAVMLLRFHCVAVILRLRSVDAALPR